MGLMCGVYNFRTLHRQFVCHAMLRLQHQQKYRAKSRQPSGAAERGRAMDREDHPSIHLYPSIFQSAYPVSVASSSQSQILYYIYIFIHILSKCQNKNIWDSPYEQEQLIHAGTTLPSKHTSRVSDPLVYTTTLCIDILYILWFTCRNIFSLFLASFLLF